MSLPLRLRKSLELVVGPAPADFCSAIAEADLSIVRTNGGKVPHIGHSTGPARSSGLIGPKAARYDRFGLVAVI